MNDFKALLTQLEEKRAESRIIVEDVDPRVRAGVEAIVRNANSDIRLIEAKYKESVMNTVVLIGVNGAFGKEFAELAQSKFNTLAVDFSLVKENILKTLAAKNAGATYTTNVHFMVLDELSRVRTAYDVVRLPNPQISGYNDGIYDAPLDFAITTLFEKNYGSGLYSAVTRREIGKQALEKNFNGELLPVVVYNLFGTVDTNFLPNPVTTLTVNEKVTLKSVKAALGEIRSVVLNKASNKTDLIMDQKGEDENEQQ
jgi:hypothetical protein